MQLTGTQVHGLKRLKRDHVHEQRRERAGVARVLRREPADPPGARPAFRYRNKGDMATIGRARAVADVWGRSFSGLVAWILWSVIHITFLIGFRNKVLVMVNWAWQWIVQTRGARLITGNPEMHVESPVDLSADAG